MNGVSGNKINIDSKPELVNMPAVNKLYNGIVKEFNKCLSKDEQVKQIRIVSDEWTPDSGELSPTLKLKRRVLLDKYKELISDIFNK